MRVSIGVGLSAILSACGGSEPPPMMMMNPGITLSTLCAELAKVDCERLATCGTLYAPIDRELCEARQTAVACEPVSRALTAAVGAGELAYFELAAQECRTAIGKLACDVGLDYELLDVPACAGMLEAQSVADGTCQVAESCTEGHFCDPSAGCPGNCRAFRGNNEGCGFSDPCGPGLFCAATGMVCRARVALGGTCDLSVNGNACAAGSYCDTSQPGTQTCAPVRGRNQGCTSPFECIVGARCIRNRCSVGLEGDACDRNSDCKGGLPCSNARCTKPLGFEEDCTSGALCAEGLTCTSSAGATLCRPRPLEGDECSDTRPCYLARCDNRVCVPAIADGQTCTDAADCLPGRVCRDMVCAVDVPVCVP